MCEAYGKSAVGQSKHCSDYTLHMGDGTLKTIRWAGQLSYGSTHHASVETGESESNLNVACLSGVRNASDNRGSQASADRVTGLEAN